MSRTTTPKGTDDVTDTKTQEADPSTALVTLPTWQAVTPGQPALDAPAAAHLSPLAAFQPDRVDICTGYQLAVVDGTSTAAHLKAALEHVRAAADRTGDEDRARISSALRLIRSELDRTARTLHINY